MGAADVVPGVSGGTMALILGIYQQLIEAIRSFDSLWLKAIIHADVRGVRERPHFGFILPLVAGILAALAFFTRVVPLPALIESHPEQVYGLFFGLIAGSIIILLLNFRLQRMTLLALMLGMLVGLWIFTRVPAETPDAAWFIFLSGMLAISAMLLPGISGSFILLLMKKYSTVFGAIGAFNLAVLLPFFAGVLTGLILFSRLLSWLLQRFYANTLAVIIGLLLASLWIIWPFQLRIYAIIADKTKMTGSSPVLPDPGLASTWQAFGLMLLGIIFVLLLERLARK